MRLPDDWGDKAPVTDLVADIFYVGPSFFGAFDRTGELAYTPVGSTGRVLNVGAPETPTGGTYLTYHMRVEGDRYAKPFVTQLNGDVRSRAFGQWGIKVESTFGEARALRDWSIHGSARVFIISPSYWHRRGVRSGLTNAPERLWRMCEIGVQRGYFIKALKGQLSRLSAWDLAQTAFWMLIDHLVPIPSMEDVEDTKRVATCIGMAIWGSDANAEQDLDVAARMFAPEIATVNHWGRAGEGIQNPRQICSEESVGHA